MTKSATTIDPQRPHAGAPSMPATHHQPVLGILFMLIAGTLFPVMNGLVQVMSPRYSSEQIAWMRTITHLVFVIAIFAPSHGLVGLVRTNAPVLQMMRSLALTISTLCFFTGVKFLPLAKAASISFTAPLIVTLLAVPLLGERWRLDRLVAIAIGFCGVLIVVQPGSAVFQWASLLVLASATSYGFYQIITRKVAGRDSPETCAVYSALLGSIVLALAAPWSFRWPDSWSDGAILCSLGVLGGIGHYCVARALHYAPASVVSPFSYWQMIGSVFVGYLISGLWPAATTWLGAATIIAAGLYLGWQETRRRDPAVPLATASPTPSSSAAAVPVRL